MELEILKDKQAKNIIKSKISDVISRYTTISTGCEYDDYINLFHNITKNRYVNILECGSGVSTIVIALALMENYKNTGIMGSVDSMEELEEYYTFAKEHTPEDLKPYINYIHSECIHDYYSVFRGRRYKDTPIKQYDFCWIDGPNFSEEKIKGRHSFDFDLLYSILHTTGKVGAMIDGRYSTVYVMKKLFGKKVTSHYSRRTNLSISLVQPVYKRDLLIVSKSSFRKLFEKRRYIEDPADSMLEEYTDE